MIGMAWIGDTGVPKLPVCHPSARTSLVGGLIQRSGVPNPVVQKPAATWPEGLLGAWPTH